MTKMRVGHGYDVHKLESGRKLILGGVNIPNDKGLLGHSDADVLVHSIIDSILGALALGDIGKLFPDSDSKYKDADSLELLSMALKVADKTGFSLCNIDCTIVAQEPKLGRYIGLMRENIAQMCNIPTDAVSIKATTEEGLGFSGRKEGISSHAVCLMFKE